MRAFLLIVLFWLALFIACKPPSTSDALKNPKEFVQPPEIPLGFKLHMSFEEAIKIAKANAKYSILRKDMMVDELNCGRDWAYDFVAKTNYQSRVLDLDVRIFGSYANGLDKIKYDSRNLPRDSINIPARLWDRFDELYGPGKNVPGLYTSERAMTLYYGDGWEVKYSGGLDNSNFPHFHLVYSDDRMWDKKTTTSNVKL